MSTHENHGARRHLNRFHVEPEKPEKPESDSVIELEKTPDTPASDAPPAAPHSKKQTPKHHRK